MSENKTIDYYDKFAKLYFDKTVLADMSGTCDCFIKHIKPGGLIVDVGAGSGRDMLYFKTKGFIVEGIDASVEMCRLASAYTGIQVECVEIQRWIPQKQYAGVWANASLVHLHEDEIRMFLQKLPNILEDEGCAYISFKNGIVTGEDCKGRYFTNITEEKIKGLIQSCSCLQTIECWKTADKLDRENISWINIIIKNVKVKANQENYDE